MSRLRAVDLFCGFGGFTLGAEAAGLRVVAAANHSEIAVEAHSAAHPRTRHYLADLSDSFDYTSLPRFEILIASPACQGSSPAAQPARARSARVRRYHEALRHTAWAVSACADYCEPRAIIVENVANFPRLFRQFGSWVQSLRDVGYRCQTAILRASTCGHTPQRRDRFFLVALRGRKRAGESHVLDLPTHAEPAFGPCVQWDADVPWSRVRDATPAVRNRIARSRKRHGRRFLTQHTSDHYGVPLNQPIRTITTKDQWAIVDGAHYRPLTLRENARGMGFPESWQWPAHATRTQVVRGFGNAVPPGLAEAVCERVVSL